MQSALSVRIFLAGDRCRYTLHQPPMILTTRSLILALCSSMSCGTTPAVSIYVSIYTAMCEAIVPHCRHEGALILKAKAKAKGRRQRHIGIAMR